MASLARQLSRAAPGASAAGRHRLGRGPSADRRRPPTAACAAASTARSCARRAAPSASCWPRARRSRCSCVGRKGRDQLRRDFAPAHRRDHRRISASRGSASATPRRSPSASWRCSRPASSTSATVIFNRFKSAMTQIVTRQQLIPLAGPGAGAAATGACGRRDLRVRAGRGRDPGRAAAAQPRRPDLPRAAGERGERAGRADDGDGQRHPQRRRHDQAS